MRRVHLMEKMRKICQVHLMKKRKKLRNFLVKTRTTIFQENPVPGGNLVLSKKPHKCNDVNHIGNRCVFAAFCLKDYDNGENKWNNQCLACADRESKVPLLILIAILLLVYVP